MRNKYTKKGDLNNSDFIPDLSRFSHYKKWKECDKKVINSLPITGVHNKLKNSIVFFLFINSFLTSLSFLHYRNILGFSSSILVSFSPPANMHALGWTEVECHPARYVMELNVVILFEVPWSWCRARWLWSSMSTPSSSISGARLGLVHE